LSVLLEPAVVDRVIPAVPPPEAVKRSVYVALDERPLTVTLEPDFVKPVTPAKPNGIEIAVVGA
jgi:hypothetical protein